MRSLSVQPAPPFKLLLRVLVFTRNTFGDAGAAALAKVLADPDNFENLDEEIMRVIFDLFDSDGGGTIGREEVPEMIRTLLFEVPSEEQVDQLIANRALLEEIQQELRELL